MDAKISKQPVQSPTDRAAKQERRHELCRETKGDAHRRRRRSRLLCRRLASLNFVEPLAKRAQVLGIASVVAHAVFAVKTRWKLGLRGRLEGARTIGLGLYPVKN